MRRLSKLLPVLLVLLLLPLGALAANMPLREESASLERGKRLSLLDPAWTGTLTWASTDKRIATVSRKGVVSGRRAGTASITATAPDGSVYACEVTVTQPVSRVKLAASRVTLEKGRQYTLIPVLSPTNATDKTVRFATSDVSVASVDENGRVTGLRAGKATITAYAHNGKKASATVTVTQPVLSIDLKAPVTTVERGKRISLTAAPLPGDATDKKLTWTSSDRAVATVSSKGVVSGRRAGSAVITATSKGGVSVSCTVTVTQPVSRIKMPVSRITLEKGSQHALVPVLSPADATDKTVRFASSDVSVASVDENGRVTGLRAGKATITAYAHNGKKASATVTVTQPVLSIDLKAPVTTVERGKRISLTAAPLPGDATDKKLTWTSSDRAVATVSGKGVVSGRRAGTAVITATSRNGVSASCAVTVTQPVSRVRLSDSRLKLGRNSVYSLTATVQPEDATDQTLRYESSRPDIASVDQKGVITARADGEAIITVRAINGKKATVRVTVKSKPVTGLSLSASHLALLPGASASLSAQVAPADATVRAVTYTSDNPAVATVSPEGVVTAVSSGSATIRAVSVENARFEAECRVFVRSPGDKQRLSGITIGINPGHQTKAVTIQDPLAPGSRKTGNRIGCGTTGVKTRAREYEVNLAVALKLRDRLVQEGATVVLTRTRNDVNLSNIERAQLLNRAQVDLALQLHCNATGTGNRTANGIVLYAKPADNPALSASAYMLDAMVQATGAIKLGVKKSDGYMSLNWSETPSILVEMGYMSNPAEDVLLSTPAYQDKLVEGMYEGIAAYFGR